MRLDLKSMLVRLAVPKLTIDDLAAAQDMLRELGADGDRMRWGELNSGFIAALTLPPNGRGPSNKLANLKIRTLTAFCDSKCPLSRPTNIAARGLP
jgi:hypothetical protein